MSDPTKVTLIHSASGAEVEVDAVNHREIAMWGTRGYSPETEPDAEPEVIATKAQDEPEPER